jgi:hypothetical protein
MAATIHGFSANEMKPQPGLQITRSESGGFSATHEIIIKAEDFANLAPNFARGALLYDIDPTIPPPFDELLTIDTISFTRTDGDLYVFNITATGAPAQFENDELAPGVEPTYTLTGQLSDAPLSEHHLWILLTDLDKKILGLMLAEFYQYNILTGKVILINQDNTGWVDASEQLSGDVAKDFATRIQQGRTTYQKAVYTWTETTEGSQVLEGFADLGKIATVRGNPPTPLGQGRDWMLTNLTQSQSGELYRTTFEWTLSDRGGWDDFLYDY